MADDEIVEEGQEPEEQQIEETETFDEARARAALAKANREAANLRKRLKEIEPAAKRAKELDEASRTEVEKARAQARDETLAEVLKDRALDRVETKAAKSFADPEDARALLASHVDDFIVDGKVDGEAIDKALADLLKRKPHLGVQGKRFEGSADGGARKPSRPEQLTKQDLTKMTPEQIVEARLKGQLNDLMGVDT